MEDILDSMSGNPKWDTPVMKALKNSDFKIPEVEDQYFEYFDKVMANPDLAMALENPKFQAAIIDCSQNPWSLLKYLFDQEIMDVFIKLSELIPE